MPNLGSEWRETNRVDEYERMFGDHGEHGTWLRVHKWPGTGVNGPWNCFVDGRKVFVRHSLEQAQGDVEQHAAHEAQKVAEARAAEAAAKVPQPTLSEEVSALLNKHSRENESDTPDFILAEYLMRALESYEKAISDRDRWHGVDD